MSRPAESDSSDEDVLYAINSDTTDVDSDDVEERSVSGESHLSQESSDDEGDTTNTEKLESWSGKVLKPNLPYYDGELKLSNDFESKMPANPSPRDFFQLYFTPELITYIVNQSNLYRVQAKKTKQMPMNEADLNYLLGFLFYSSVVPLPNKRDYWSSFCRQTMVADVITRDRIMYLLSILHFHDNSIEKHKCEKVEPILSYFNERCKLIAEQEKNLSIDEQMIAYKRTTAPTSFRQYMPKKPTKRGFKVWTRCGVSAFVYEMILYCGASKPVPSASALSDSSLKRASRRSITTTITSSDSQSVNAQRERLLKQYGSSGLVVLDLIKNVPAGSSIFVDNYFASTKLIKKMTQLGYRVTCTLRSNRLEKCPVSTDKQFETKERGFSEAFISDDETCNVIAWKDSKRVLLGSNHVGSEPKETLRRWDKVKRCKVDVTAPQIINQYNKFMGGVDTMDMLVALHPIPFRSKRWYMRIIWRIFDLMVINSWILMNSRRDDSHGSTSHGTFRLYHFKSEIAKFLLRKPMIQPLQPTSSNSTLNADLSDEENAPMAKRKREARSDVPEITRADAYNHWPIFVSAMNNTRCKNEACSAKTYWKCSKCDVHLCLTANRNCFKNYHTDD